MRQLHLLPTPVHSYLLMELADIASFDLAWLQDKLDPDVYFEGLLQSGVARRHEWVRQEILRNQNLVRQVWCEGDELWYWRFRIQGGISGSDGLVLLRNGRVFRVWCNGRIL